MSTSNNQELERIGALWKKQSQNGNAYFSGQVTVEGKTVDILVFPFRNKTNESWPDAKIVIAPPREEKQQERSRPSNSNRSYSNNRRGQTTTTSRRSTSARNDKDIDF